MKHHNFNWTSYMVLSIICAVLCYHFLIHNQYITGGFFIVLVIIFFVGATAIVKKKSKETENILSAILHKDFGLSPKKETDNPVKNQAVQLYYDLKNENRLLNSYKLLYESILDQLDIGFLILNQEQDEKWKLFFSNCKFLQTLNIPKYNHWEYYEDKSPHFYELIQKTNYQDSQQSIELYEAGGAKEIYSLRTARVSFQQDVFFVVSIESVQNIIDRKEKNAWNNLMKVISHELLNTLTPINSLLQNLEFISQQEQISEEDKTDMQESLKIINGKSQQLLQFINSYRQVAELPKPQKQQTNLKQLIENTVQLFRQEFISKNIICQLELQSLETVADPKMMERVLTNLIGNAIIFVEDCDTKKIAIRLYKKDFRTVLSVEDTGNGIPIEIKDKIFMPFFTTRQNGSGIGLTLAKSIIEAHNGYITHRNTEDGSIFEVWWV